MSKKDAVPKIGLRATAGKRTLAFGLVRSSVGRVCLCPGEHEVCPLVEAEDRRCNTSAPAPVGHAFAQ